MLLRFFKVERAVMEMIMVFGFRFSFGFGQYCSERGERVPLSLYIAVHFSTEARACTFVAVLHIHFMTLFVTAFHRRSVKVHGFTGMKVRFFYSCYHYYTVVLHFIIFSMPNRSRKPPFSMSVSGKTKNT